MKKEEKRKKKKRMIMIVSLKNSKMKENMLIITIMP